MSGDLLQIPLSIITDSILPTSYVFVPDPFSNESQVTSLNAPLLYLRQIISQPLVPSPSKLGKQQGKVQGRGT